MQTPEGSSAGRSRPARALAARREGRDADSTTKRAGLHAATRPPGDRLLAAHIHPETHLKARAKEGVREPVRSASKEKAPSDGEEGGDRGLGPSEDGAPVPPSAQQQEPSSGVKCKAANGPFPRDTYRGWSAEGGSGTAGCLWLPLLASWAPASLRSGCEGQRRCSDKQEVLWLHRESTASTARRVPCGSLRAPAGPLTSDKGATRTPQVLLHFPSWKISWSLQVIFSTALGT